MTQAYVGARRARVRNIPLECRGFSGTDPPAEADVYRRRPQFVGRSLFGLAAGGARFGFLEPIINDDNAIAER
jgi:hypothetical protein